MPEMFVISMLTQLPAWFVAAADGPVGLPVDSPLSVVTHRLPRTIEREEVNYIAELCEEPLSHSEIYNPIVLRSACPLCGHQIKAIENIPVLSQLAS